MLKCHKRTWYINNKHKVLERKRILLKEDRERFINELGGKCVLCGEADSHVLDFDHIGNDGAEWRKQHNKNVVIYFRKFGIDKTSFQLLCKNCNWRKEKIRRQKKANLITPET